MFSTKKILWLASFSLLLGLSACVTKHNDVAKTEEQKTAEAEGAQNSTSPFTSTSWCRVDDWESFQVVMRVTPSFGQSKMEYLKITPDAPQTLYRFPIQFVWEEKKDDNFRPNLFSLALNTDAEKIKTLDGFDEQKRIADELFPNNPQLKKRNGEFAPTVAMTMKTRSSTTGDVIPRNMYPCEMYSETLKEDGTLRPFTEILLTISQAMSSFAPEGLNHVAQAMAITYPVEEIQMPLANLADSQWCSWKEVDVDRLLLKTISFSSTKFVENAHSENFLLYPDEESKNKFLSDNANHSESFTMSSAGGRLVGKNQTDIGSQSFPANELFAFVKDAKGVVIMVRMDPKAPETSRPTFTDFYYDCRDDRALGFSTGFKENLPKILELQKNKAHE